MAASSTKQILRKAILLYPPFLLGLSALHRFWPRRRGFLALTAVFAPYLFLPLLLLLPAARRRDARLLRLGLCACALVYAVRFLPGTPRQPRRAMPGARRFSVMSWNILFRNRRAAEIPAFLASGPADVVALHELRPSHADMIRRDPALAKRYPYQLLCPHGRASGIGLLSVFPILEHSSHEMPPAICARLDLGAGRTVIVVSAHPTFGDPRRRDPEPADRTRLVAALRQIVDPRFLRYDPSFRDRGIARVRALVDPLLGRGESLLLVGDFNVTEREIAYRELTAGLCDAHRNAGGGASNTWRPDWLMGLPFGLLRIDYLLSTPDIRPLRVSADCTPRGSDHGIMSGEFELAAPA